jgi:hypothetical protein
LLLLSCVLNFLEDIKIKNGSSEKKKALQYKYKYDSIKKAMD